MSAETTCSRCGGVVTGERCPRCGPISDVEETRHKLEASRERLSAWRERLERRLEEVERKRSLLDGPEARAAARAPTQRVAAEDSLVGSTSEILEVEAVAASLRAAEAAIAAADDSAAATSPAESDSRAGSTPGQRLGSMPTPQLIESEAVERRGDLLSGDLIGPRGDGGGHGGPLVVAVDANDNLAIEDVDDLPTPSAVLRAAAILLDLLLLLLLPASLVTFPAAAWALGSDLASTWALNGGRLAPYFIAMFVALYALFLGAYGRTPGMRLVGIRVVDDSGSAPTFVVATLRGLLLPLLLFAPIERMTGTRAISE